MQSAGRLWQVVDQGETSRAGLPLQGEAMSGIKKSKRGGGQVQTSVTHTLSLSDYCTSILSFFDAASVHDLQRTHSTGECL